jgi:hypothetical protein
MNVYECEGKNVFMKVKDGMYHSKLLHSMEFFYEILQFIQEQ